MRRGPVIKLSYDIAEGAALYPGTPETVIAPAKRMDGGDSCNTYVVTISTHAGTHIDAPRHFYKRGKAVSDYSLESFIFKRPLIINCRKGFGEAIEIGDVGPVKGLQHADILLFRTGFSRFRERNKAVYVSKNPYMSARLCAWIKDSLPNLRAIGIDCISIASSGHKEEGRDAHRCLLGGNGTQDKAILIIEDMHIPQLQKDFDRIAVVPMFIKGVDSSPCTIAGYSNG